MKTVFRKELKYKVPLSDFSMMEPQIRAVFDPDEHGEDGVYAVRSLYFDSALDQDLHDNLDGAMEKRKIRIRIYSPHDEKAKLEYKCKSGSDGVKYSLTLTRQEAMEMENHRYECLHGKYEDLAMFLYLKMQRYLYRPKTIVEYKRRAYSFPMNNIRLTFDYEIRGSDSPYGLFNERPFLRPVFPEGMGILELKYDEFIPTPIRKLMERCDVIQTSYSKYTAARLSGM